MPDRQNIDCSQLDVGYEFPPAEFHFEQATVVAYIRAVGEDSSLYKEVNLVPPMAVAAFAMKALAENMGLSEGSVHVTQELEFKETVNITDNLISRSKVSRKQVRGGFHLLNIDLGVFNQNQKQVLTGRMGFILPQKVGK